MAFYCLTSVWLWSGLLSHHASYGLPSGRLVALPLIAIAGVPPLLGFYAKLGVVIAVQETGLMSYALLGLVLSAGSSVFYLRWLLSDNTAVPILQPLQSGAIAILCTAACLVSLDLASARLRFAYSHPSWCSLNCPLITSRELVRLRPCGGIRKRL